MTLSEQATAKLREAILVGTVSNGVSITERQISELLEMSRTPVRAAMQALANEGLLVYESQRGYRVRNIDLETIVDAYKVRGALEALACQIVCENGLPNDTAEILKSCIEEGAALLKDAGAVFHQEEWQNMNDRFHQAIIDAANNDTLSSSLEKVVLMPMVSFKVIAVTNISVNITMLESAQRDHEQIYRSLVAGQGIRASNRMSEHIAIAADLISKDTRKVV